MAERIDIVITERGGQRTVRRIREIGTTATAANAGVQALQRSLLAIGGVALFGRLVGQVATFEQTLATVRGVSGATEEQFRELTATARELGATTRFSATEAGEGLLFLARAGFTVEESIDTVDDTLRLAQAGALELGRAADIASNVLTGFRLETGEAGRVVDVLALAANSANTDVEQLGDAIKFVAPVAASFGVSIEEASAAVGTLSNAGLQASLAGTGLRRVIAELEGPSSRTERILSDLGLSAEDVQISTVGLNQALETLRDAGLTGSQALEAFGQRGGPAAIALIENVEATNQLTEAFREAGGTAEEIAAIQDDTLLGSLLRVRSAFQEVVLAFSDSGPGGVLRSFFEGLANTLRFLGNNIEIVQVSLFFLALTVLPLAVSAAGALLGVLVSLAGTALVIGAPIAVAIAAIVGLLQGLRGELQITEEGTATFRDFVVAAFQVLSETIPQVFNGIADAFRPFLENLGILSEETEFTLFDILRIAAAFVDGFAGTFVGLGNALRIAFEDPLRTVQAIFVTAINAIVDALEFLSDAITSVIFGIGSQLDIFGRRLNIAFINIGGAIDQLRAGNFSEAGRFLEEALFQIEQGSSNLVTGFGDAISREFDALRQEDVLARIEGPLADDARDLGEAVGQALSDGINNTTGATDLVGAIEERTALVAAERQSRELLEAELERQRNQGGGTVPQGRGGAPGTPGGDPQEQIRSSIEGFRAGFDEVGTIINSFSDQAEATIVNAFGAAEDAIVEFVQTGEFNFSKLVDSILADLTRLLVRQALFSLISGFGGGGAGLAAGAASGAISARQFGGPVTRGRPFLVGEQGPEIFNPPSNGNIIPNGDIGGGAGPQNITIVNQTSREEIFESLNSPEGEQVIVNAISRKRRAVREVVAT